MREYRRGAWSLTTQTLSLLVLLCNIYFTYGNPQDIIDEGGLTCSNCKPELPIEEVVCKRYPKENVLFSSDNFPANYNQNTKCLYFMNATEGKKVHLTFYMFDTEVNNRCSYDKVEVYDSNGTRIHKYCGENSKNLHVVSSGENLFFNFTTDKVQEKQGFLAKWEEVDGDFTFEDNPDAEGTYYIAYPTSFIEDSPEKICVELFEDQMGGDVEGHVDIYVESKIDKEKSGSKDNWIFGETHPEPLGRQEFRIPKDTKTKCFEIVIPKSNSASKGLLRFVMRSEVDGGRLDVDTFKKINIFQRENYPLIQTDKGFYKAKDTVKFRILILDHDLKPDQEVQSVDEIWVEDPKNRRIEQWKSIDLEKGLLQKEFVLSEEPELGDWMIHFIAGPVSSKATFKVSEYVLPKFDVKITPPAAVLKDAQFVEFKICATYTHGGSVKGELSSVFSSSRLIRSWPRRQEEKRQYDFTTKVETEDCGVVSIDQKQLRHLTEKVNNFKLEVKFKEMGTETPAEDEWSGSLTDKAIKLEVKDGSDNFMVGGFPYTGEFSVTNHDGSPRDEEIEVCTAFYRDVNKVRNIFNGRGIWSMDEEEIAEAGEKMVNLRHSRKCEKISSDDGKIKFWVPMNNIPDDVEKLIIKATALNYPGNKTTGMKQPIAKLHVSLQHGNPEMTVSLNDKKKSTVSCDAVFKPKVYFSAKKDEEFDLHYQALSKGTIYKSGNIKVTVFEKSDALTSLIGSEGSAAQPHKLTSLENENESSSSSFRDKVVSYQELEFSIDFRVSPTLKLIIFVNKGNSTLADSYTYDIEPCQKHKVSAQFSEEKVYPGSPVSLTVSAQPGSLCALAAIDKSVELLGNSNKITKGTLKKLQAQIGDRKTSRSENYWEYQRKCPEIYEILKVFEDSGVKLITDLPISRSCNIITDAVNEEEIGYEVAHSEAYADVSSGEAMPSMLRGRHRVGEAGATSASVNMRMYKTRMREFDGPLVKPTLELRHIFPENWLFKLENVTTSARTREMMAPHTITTWLGEAFCLHDEAGLGVAEPDQLLVKQDFFAEINLPYSVKRGEVFPLNISVFNSVSQDLPIRAELIVENSEIKADVTQVDLCVKPKNNEVRTFKVSALELGEVNITVKATIISGVENCKDVSLGEGFYDALVKPLRVKPEGVPVEIVKSDFKCVEGGDDEFVLDRLELPDNLVSGSDRAWVYVTGDVMAPALDNVGNLVRLPTGCGEQNMVGLVPNIYLMDYLQGVGKSMPDIERKAKEYMNIGYSRQQNYRHDNGAYSIWGGDGDKDGSTWLTAFVVKAFSEASRFISVDSRLVQTSVNWLLENQQENGCFRKRGYVHSSYLKGGSSDDSLTAFVLTALNTALANMGEIEIPSQKLGSAYDCMWKNLNSSDLYTSILVAHADNYKSYIIEAQQSKESQNLMSEIASKANISTGAKFWETQKKSVSCDYCWWSYRPSSEAVEMTAYNIMSYVLTDQLPLALDSVKWLAKQRNSQGGFVSTQDTVVALQALSMYSAQVTDIELAMSLDITEDEKKLASVTLGKDNAQLLQQHKVTQLPANLAVKSSGPGCAMVQSVLRYNTKEVKGNNGFTLTVEPKDLNSIDEDPKLRICSTYTGEREKTGMVLVEVELVTGWEAYSPERLVNEVDSGVQRVETDKDENKVVLYFDEITSDGRCVELEMKDVMTIDDAKDALVTVYDYYNREETASVLYNMEPQMYGDDA